MASTKFTTVDAQGAIIDTASILTLFSECLETAQGEVRFTETAVHGLITLLHGAASVMNDAIPYVGAGLGVERETEERSTRSAQVTEARRQGYDEGMAFAIDMMKVLKPELAEAAQAKIDATNAETPPEPNPVPELTEPLPAEGGGAASLSA